MAKDNPLKSIKPNKTFKHALLFTCLMAPLLTQCVATEQNVKNLDLRIRTLNNRLINVDQDLADIKDITGRGAKKNSVETLQRKQAEVNSEVERFKTQILQIKGQLDEGSHHYQTLQDANNSLRETVGNNQNEMRSRVKDVNSTLDSTNKTLTLLVARVETLEKSLTQTRADLASMSQARAMDAAKFAREAARKAEEAAAEAQVKVEKAADISSKKQIKPAKSKKAVSTHTKPTAHKAATSAKNHVTPPKRKPATNGPGINLYNKALTNFKAKKFQNAYIGFSDYIEKYPKGKMVANARFWLGDSLYNQGEYELAILEYQKVIADFSRHPKAASALLKQGLAFEKLKDKETAKIVYYKLLDEYGKSDQAATARKRVKALK